MLRLWRINVFGAVALVVWGSDLFAQQSLPQQLVNGDMESAADDNTPVGWFFGSSSGGKFAVDSENALEGEQSALLDATQSDPKASRLFTNLAQTIDGAAWRGKTVRYRAAVRTGEMEAAAGLVNSREFGEV